MTHNFSRIGFVLAIAFVAGCSSEAKKDDKETAKTPALDGANFLVSTAPQDPRDIIPLRKGVEDGQDVVVIGRIGGSTDPWVEGVAAFQLVDRSLAACSDIPGDACPVPWDYCCVTDKLPDATTLVKVVDDQGQLVSTGAKELLGVSELQTVVVTGKARKDYAGNVTILARKIYIDPNNPGQVKRDDDGSKGHATDHDHEKPHEHGEDHDSDVKGES